MPRRPPPRPRKRPVQARSQATVAAIVDAAARVLVQGGYDAFTTNRVAERAGVSVGSLYQYFPHKEALLAELKARHVGELERGFEAVMARVGDAPLADVVAALIEANVAAHLIAPELHRILSAEVPDIGPVDASLTYDQRVTARVRGLLAARAHEITVRDLDLATYLIVRTVEATIHEAVVEQPRALASGAVGGEVTRLLLGYLTMGAPDVANRHPRNGTIPRARKPLPSASARTPRGRAARRR